MIRRCDICGKEVDQNSMQDIGYGQSVEWWCWECYLNSQREAAASDMYRRHKLHKISEKNK